MRQSEVTNNLPHNFFPSKLNKDVMGQLSSDVKRDIQDAYRSTDEYRTSQDLVRHFENEKSWHELHNAHVMAEARKSKDWGVDD